MGRRKKYNTEEERKEAHREACKRFREEHPDYMVEWRKNNPDKVKAYNAAYYKKNNEEILAWHAAYDAAYNATPFGRARYLVGRYRSADKKQNRGECTITPQWVVDNVFSGQVCHYCGQTDWHLLGCDRIDNTLPHTPENCVPCCCDCNKKKGTTEYDEFMRRMGKIA